MTPEQLAARWLADVPRHYDANAERVILEAEALAAIARHLAPGDDLVERHADKERNLLLNTALSDLDRIIKYHNPEIDTSLNNLVWDRLDNLAVAIEARAAARLSALTAERDELVEALTNLPAVYAHQINTGVREVYDPLQRFYTMESVLAAITQKDRTDD